MSAPDRGTRLFIALGVMLTLAGLPLGMAGSVTEAKRDAAAAGRSAAWTAAPGAVSEGALFWFGIGGVVSLVGVVLACVGFYRLWRSGRLIRPQP